jgi:hypothetical protein
MSVFATLLRAEKVAMLFGNMAACSKYLQDTSMKLQSASLLLLISFSLIPTAAPADEGFTSLFNGRDLSGWRGDKEFWSVQDGAITAKTTADSRLTKEKYNTFLIWEGGQPADFELRLKYKIVGGNSGVQYRSRVIDEAKFIVSGYQADIDASPKYTGMNYEEKARAFLAQRGEKVTVAADGKKEAEKFGDPVDLQAKVKNEDWNEYRIVAKGNHLQHYVNGVLMSEVIDNQKDKAATSGVLALQAHANFAMTVQFKDIQLKELK